MTTVTLVTPVYPDWPGGPCLYCGRGQDDHPAADEVRAP